MVRSYNTLQRSQHDDFHRSSVYLFVRDNEFFVRNVSFSDKSFNATLLDDQNFFGYFSPPSENAPTVARENPVPLANPLILVRVSGFLLMPLIAIKRSIKNAARKLALGTSHSVS